MSTVRAGEPSEGKIRGWHRDRLAAVYVRQSSRQQVADHGESTRLQYGLKDRAAALGWPASRVMVIDEDLGRSAAGAAERPGFARLVAEITMGHVGLVLWRTREGSIRGSSVVPANGDRTDRVHHGA